MATSNSPPCAVLDSCAWLSVIKGEPTATLIRPLLARINAGEVRLVGSTLLLAEIYKPSADPNENQHQNQILAMLESRPVDLVDVSPRVAKEAAQLRLAHGFSTPDAVHLATAKLAKADWFVTMDAELARKTPQLEEVRLCLVARSTREIDLPWITSMMQDPLTGVEDTSNVVPLRRP